MKLVLYEVSTVLRATVQTLVARRPRSGDLCIPGIGLACSDVSKKCCLHLQGNNVGLRQLPDATCDINQPGTRQHRQHTYIVILRGVRVTTVAVKKQLHILSVSVALVIHHAKRIRRIILSSLASPAVPYLSTLFHKRHDF